MFMALDNFLPAVARIVYPSPVVKFLAMAPLPMGDAPSALVCSLMLKTCTTISMTAFRPLERQSWRRFTVEQYDLFASDPTRV